MPALPFPEEPHALPERPLTRSTSLIHMASHYTGARPSPSSSSGCLGRLPHQQNHHRALPLTSLLPSSFDEEERNMEQRINAVFGQTRSGEISRRPYNFTSSVPREDSMGNLSDAPTYFTGAPPPSYRSRAASVCTTSSFGCIDGMNEDYRLMSQRRAMQRERGVRGTFRRFVHRARFI